jgi:polyhydroxybutyrate depolymerase
VISVDGFPRQYIVYVPSSGATRQRPVVFMHHGSSGTGLKFFNISGWREKADEVGLVAVFPTALEVYFLEESRCTTKWNGYGLDVQIHPDIKPVFFHSNGERQDYSDEAPWPADDIGFVRAMLGDLRRGLPVDPSRVYMSGFSNGAGFTFRASVELSDVLAAVGLSGGGQRGPQDGPPPVPLRAIPVALQLGECDPKIAEGLGIPLDVDSCLSGQSNGIPIHPADILGNTILAERIEFHLDTFGLAHTPDRTVDGPQAACLGWWTPAGATAARYQFEVLGSLTHEYPRCNANACNNPHRFSAADRFWAFFNTTGGCAVPQ